MAAALRRVAEDSARQLAEEGGGGCSAPVPEPGWRAVQIGIREWGRSKAVKQQQQQQQAGGGGGGSQPEQPVRISVTRCAMPAPLPTMVCCATKNCGLVFGKVLGAVGWRTLNAGNLVHARNHVKRP